jgi:hypothetical protein
MVGERVVDEGPSELHDAPNPRAVIANRVRKVMLHLFMFQFRQNQGSNGTHGNLLGQNPPQASGGKERGSTS